MWRVCSVCGQTSSTSLSVSESYVRGTCSTLPMPCACAMYPAALPKPVRRTMRLAFLLHSVYTSSPTMYLRRTSECVSSLITCSTRALADARDTGTTHGTRAQHKHGTRDVHLRCASCLLRLLLRFTQCNAGITEMLTCSAHRHRFVSMCVEGVCVAPIPVRGESCPPRACCARPTPAAP